MAQQRLLGDDIGGRYPAQRHARRSGVRADKELLNGGALGGGMQAEALADVRAIFIVIGDFQPAAFIIRAVLQIHSATAQHQRVF